MNCLSLNYSNYGKEIKQRGLIVENSFQITTINLADNSTRIREMFKYACFVGIATLVFCKVFGYDLRTSCEIILVSGIFWGISSYVSSYFERNARSMMRHFEQITAERRSEVPRSRIIIGSPSELIEMKKRAILLLEHSLQKSP